MSPSDLPSREDRAIVTNAETPSAPAGSRGLRSNRRGGVLSVIITIIVIAILIWVILEILRPGF